MGKRSLRQSLHSMGRGSRWSEEEARRVLDEWEASGEPLTAFAQGRGLVPQRLYWWRKRLAIGGRARRADETWSGSVAPLIPVTVRGALAESSVAVLRLDGTPRVELHALDDASASWVASLVKALGASS